MDSFLAEMGTSPAVARPPSAREISALAAAAAAAMLPVFALGRADLVLVSPQPLRTKSAVTQAKQRKTPAGKAEKARYFASPKGKAAQARYAATPKGKAKTARAEKKKGDRIKAVMAELGLTYRQVTARGLHLAKHFQ